MREEIKTIIGKCIAWNFPSLHPKSEKLDWEESTDAIFDVFIDWARKHSNVHTVLALEEEKGRNE